ncbi:MAG TPA: hypothetical protein VF974_08020 [Patescibacteria group bacterium]
MNESRDAHAIDAIYQAKKDNGKVFVVCGGSHAIVWQPAIEEMYYQGKKEQISTIQAELDGMVRPH